MYRWITVGQEGQIGRLTRLEKDWWLIRYCFCPLNSLMSVWFSQFQLRSLSSFFFSSFWLYPFRSNADIQEFYELTLLDETKTVQQKTAETLQMATKWETNPGATSIHASTRDRFGGDIPSTGQLSNCVTDLYTGEVLYHFDYVSQWSVDCNQRLLDVNWLPVSEILLRCLIFFRHD